MMAKKRLTKPRKTIVSGNDVIRVREAAISGNTEAQYKLGLMYQNGLGVPKDENLARKWFEKAKKSRQPRRDEVPQHQAEERKRQIEEESKRLKRLREYAAQGIAEA